MTPIIIPAAGDTDLVIVTRAHYEALLAIAADAGMDDEDIADIAVGLAAKAAHVAQGVDPLPPEVSRDIAAGKTVLEALRRWRGMTQVALAESAGITQGFLSDLENRRRAPGVDTRSALVAALNVPSAWLDPWPVK